MTTQETILRACTHAPDGPPRIEGGSWVGVCCECWNRGYYARRAARKAELAREPRCEVPACTRRGRYRCGADGVLLCGAHLKRARRARIDAAGPLAFIAWMTQSGTDRASLIAFAQEGGQ
jgi:hypothetical protein